MSKFGLSTLHRPRRSRLQPAHRFAVARGSHGILLLAEQIAVAIAAGVGAKARAVYGRTAAPPGGKKQGGRSGAEKGAVSGLLGPTHQTSQK